MKKRSILIIAILAALGGGAYMADVILKGRQHSGLSNFVWQWFVNRPVTCGGEPKHVAQRRGVKLGGFATLHLERSLVNSAGAAVGVSEGATLIAQEASWSSSTKTMLDVDPVHARHGASNVELLAVRSGTRALLDRIGQGNKMHMEGKQIAPSGATPAP